MVRQETPQAKMRGGGKNACARGSACARGAGTAQGKGARVGAAGVGSRHQRNLIGTRECARVVKSV